MPNFNVLLNISTPAPIFGLTKRACTFRFCKDVDAKIINCLISYFSRFYAVGLCLNKEWRSKTLQAIDDLCNPFEIEFVNKCFKYLFFKQSHTWAQPISFCGNKGLRIDRVFECEVVGEQSA